MEGDLFVLRLVERLGAIIIGGISIYLGYRLFHSVRTAGEGSAEVSFGDIKVLLSRVGPGVFFAAFGAVVLYTSIKSPVTIEERTPAGWISRSGLGEEELALERLDVRRRVAVLNQLEGKLNPALTDSERQSIDRDLVAIKLDLMRGVWSPDWPLFEAFQEWAEGGAAPQQDAGFQSAKEFFEANGGS
jgi:hypothetical protein